MKVAFVRGAFLNNYEGQNFDFRNDNDIELRGFSSLFPIDANVPFPLTRLPSLADLKKIGILDKPIRFFTNRSMGDAQVLIGLERFIRGYEIVHTADPHYYYSYQSAVMRKYNMINKLVTTWWETIPFNNEGTLPKRILKRYVMKYTDMFLCYTERAKKCLLKEGVKSRRIMVIPLGVNLEAFKPGKVKKKHFTILFVGRLVPEKGIMDLYEAYRDLHAVRPNVHLQILGSGPLEKGLKAMIRQDGLSQFVTIGVKHYKDMPQAYREADVFAVPSKKTKTWEEQYGMVFIEALASALPIVSYSTGSIPELVGQGGVLSPCGSIQKLRETLEKLYDDKLLRSKIGTMGRERAEKLYDARKTAIKMKVFYELI